MVVTRRNIIGCKCCNCNVTCCAGSTCCDATDESVDENLEKNSTENDIQIDPVVTTGKKETKILAASICE